MSRDIFKNSAVKWFGNCLQLCLSQISARELLCLCELLLCPHVRSAVLEVSSCRSAWRWVCWLGVMVVPSRSRAQNLFLCDHLRSTMAVSWKWSLCPVVPNTEILKRFHVLDMQEEAKRAIFIVKNLKEVFQLYQSSCESSRGCWRPSNQGHFC